MKKRTMCRRAHADGHCILWTRAMSVVIALLGTVFVAACTGSVTGPDERQLMVATPDSTVSPVNLGRANPGKMTDDRSGKLRSITSGWKTDWTRHSVPYDEVRWGGPKRDEFPSIDEPRFISLAEARSWLVDNEPVIVVEVRGEARAYPLQIMIRHQIVNDTFGDIPVVVTFCPLCNSAIAFDRRVDGVTLEFGTSGLLRNSDLVMYDRTTESLWQQFTGDAIVGQAMGEQLHFVTSSVVSIRDFHEAFPHGLVLSRDTGLNRRYGSNPYANYDTIGNRPFLFRGKADPRLQAMERVVSLSLGEIEIAYPLTTLVEQGVVNDVQGGQRLAVFHASGASTALGASKIAKGRDVGGTGVFEAAAEGKALTFQRDSDRILDRETGTTWNIFGRGIDGALQGTQLRPIVHGDHFWFSWAAFKPKTLVYRAD